MRYIEILRVVIICTLVAASFCITTGISYANEMATSVRRSGDGKVVVAVHPYIDESYKFTRPNKKAFPVGVMIQNRSAETVGVDDITVYESARHRTWVRRPSPYSERSFGAIMHNRYIMDDAKRMQSELCGGKCREDGLLRINEIFHALWLEPGESYFGIIYLQKRKGRTSPKRIRSVDDIVLTVPILRKDLTKGYLMNVSMDGNRDLEAIADRELLNDSGNGGDPFEEIYVGPASQRPPNVRIYGLTKELDECFSEAVGKVEVKGSSNGHYDVIEVKLDKRGQYLSDDVKESGSKKLDKAAGKVVAKMKKCRSSDSVSSDSNDNVQAYYKYKAIMGDIIAYAIDESLNADNPKDER